MEENREQPIIMPAQALNPADDNGAMSEVGSQNQEGTLGKFKSVQALRDAYDSLQAEFTKKCQLLSEIQKDKTCETASENQETSAVEEMYREESKGEDANEKEFDEEGLSEFLSQFGEAEGYAEEIKSRFPSVKAQNVSPYAVAWAEVLMDNLKNKKASSDPIINQYVLSDENFRNKIIEQYLNDLKNSQPPIVISSQSGERLSGVMPDSPKTLAEAKKRVEKMFS